MKEKDKIILDLQKSKKDFEKVVSEKIQILMNI